MSPCSSERNGDERLLTIRSVTARYWDLVQRAGDPASAFREFCTALEDSGAISLSVTGDISSIDRPSIFISNHVTVIEPLKILADQRYSVPYHSLLLDYIVERQTGRAVSHISANPRQISPLLESVAERLGFILIEKEMSPRGWSHLCQRVADVLRAGRHISVAPEGHFHAWDAVGPFRRGFWYWAVRNSTSVVPVRLRGFETMGPHLEFTFADAESPALDSDPEAFVNDIRERIFGQRFGLKLL